MTQTPGKSEPALTPFPPRFVRRFSIVCTFACIASYVITGPDKDVHGHDTILTPIQRTIRSIFNSTTIVSDEDAARIREYRSRGQQQK